MVVGRQLGSYLPHYGSTYGTRYGFGKMVCVCRGVCVCTLVSKSTSQRTAAKPDKDTAENSSKPPCRRAHWLCIRLFGLAHDKFWLLVCSCDAVHQPITMKAFSPYTLCALPHLSHSVAHWQPSNSCSNIGTLVVAMQAC